MPTHSVPRPEYPRPQFVRRDWLNLNGAWQFETDRGDSGLERGLLDRELREEILVPFPPESELSGIGDTDFLEAVWYRRALTLPAAWAGRRVLLHFGAVDHDTTVWADGKEVARHRGGFTPFTADLGDIAGAGEEVVITVRARDPKSGPQARGKQAVKYANHDCNYTRVTGIWQTVWLEPVPETHLRRPRITPDLAGSAFHLELPLSGHQRNACRWRRTASRCAGPSSSPRTVSQWWCSSAPPSGDKWVTPKAHSRPRPVGGRRSRQWMRLSGKGTSMASSTQATLRAAASRGSPMMSAKRGARPRTRTLRDGAGVGRAAGEGCVVSPDSPGGGSGGRRRNVPGRAERWVGEAGARLGSGGAHSLEPGGHGAPQAVDTGVSAVPAGGMFQSAPDVLLVGLVEDALDARHDVCRVPASCSTRRVAAPCRPPGRDTRR
ncbi:hypothetical protein STENM223S_03648 [Streptomyces tendae]